MTVEIKAVFLSHMFPNSIYPLSTPFMVERARALLNFVDLRIIAPVSYFPVLRQKLPPESEVFQGLKIFHPKYLALPSFLKVFRWIPYFKALKSTNLELNCDILHSEWIYPDAYAAVRLAKSRGIKTTAVVHGNEAIEYWGPKRMKKKYREIFSALNHIITVSKDLKMKLITYYDVPEEKISVIFNGVDLAKFPVVNSKEARAKIGVPENQYFGVCVARLSFEKNIDNLIRAIAHLGALAPQMYIIGDGPLKRALQLLVIKYKVEEKIKFVGEIPHDEIYWWIYAADFFCLPSQREGCPVVVHEALACGTPIVATSVGAIPDLVPGEEYGLLCPPSDSKALSDVISRSLKIQWDRKKIAAYGRQFTWDKVAWQTVDVFKELLN